MPTKLKTFDFPAHVGGERSKYDWDNLFDGSAYKMVAGEDYTCRTPSFKLMAEITAMKRNKNLKIATVDQGKAVVLQVTDMDSQEIAANKTKIAEYNENLRIGREKKRAESNGHVTTEVEEVEAEAEAEVEAAPAPAPKATKGRGKR